MTSCQQCGMMSSTAFCTECGAAMPKPSTSVSAPAPAPPGWYPTGNGEQRWWSGSGWAEKSPSTVYQSPPPIPAVAGRVSGFVTGLISLLTVTFTVVSAPLGIIGWVLSAKAIGSLPAGTPGRGLAVAGLTVSIISLAINLLYILLFLAYLA
jgi:hypothetical protein